MAKITPAAITKLTTGEKLTDPDNKGLYVQRNADGTASWRYMRRMSSRHGGVLIKQTLGQHGDFSIPDAQEWAAGLNGKVARGINPQEEAREAAAAAEAARIEAAKVEERKAMTVDAAWLLYMADIGDALAKKTLAMKRIRWNLDISPAIGHRPIDDIEHDDLQAIVDAKHHAKLKSASNHLVVDLKAFFRWCVLHGKRETGLRFNPAADIYRRSKNNKRDRCFAAWEVRLFIRALAQVDDFDRRICTLLALAGTRFDNTQSAHTDDFCRDTMVWQIAKTKNNKSHVVPLGPWGRTIFEGSGWVFPSKKKSKEGHQHRVANSTEIVRRVNAKMQAMTDREIVRWTVHDFRRLITTNLNRMQVRAEAVEAVLGHTEGGQKAIYNQWRFLPERTVALLDWENQLIKIAREEGVAEALGIPSADVVELRAAA